MEGLTEKIIFEQRLEAMQIWANIPKIIWLEGF